ncbi:MAG: helix-turn-helix transcriptional regulator [Lachnospiraceae bacterium]|nr:helix-turn-helix transcriptional regulator [Lachnospiraceae bacterium]
MVKRVGKKKQDKLIRAIEYIKTHLAKSPSLPETAGYIHVSPSYLSKVFIDCLQTPYSTFVLSEKIWYAQKLLVDSKMSMAEIAGAAGFSSGAYFSDCFKRITGTSPLQFRKAYTTEGRTAKPQVERKA